MGLECLISTLMLFSPCHTNIHSHTKLVLPFSFVTLYFFFFVVMTSWQNILDSLPTGTGRPGTQNNNRYNDDSIQRTPTKNINDNEGIYFYLSIK